MKQRLNKIIWLYKEITPFGRTILKTPFLASVSENKTYGCSFPLWPSLQAPIAEISCVNFN